MDNAFLQSFDCAADFGTILGLEENTPFVFGELIDDQPITPTIMTDSTNSTLTIHGHVG